LLLLVPFVALSALWAFAASLTLGEGLELRHVQTVQDHLGYPSGALGSALQAERRLSLVYLGGKDPAVRASLESQRLVTDRQAAVFERLARDKAVQDVADGEQKRWAGEVLHRLDTIGSVRRAVDVGSGGRPQAYTTYTQIIGTINGLQASLTPLRDNGVAQEAQSQVAMAWAREVLSQEDALLAGALAAKRISQGEQAQFIELIGTQRYLYAAAASGLGPADQAAYRKITSSREFAHLQAMENLFTQERVYTPSPAPGSAAAGSAAAGSGAAGSGGAGAGATPKLPISDVDWKITTSSVLTKLRGLELSLAASAEQHSKPIARGIITRIVTAGTFGLVALLIMIVLSIWVGRSVIRELTRLKRAALELANERLPSVIVRLRRGEDVDAAAEAPSLSFTTDEIDQVGQAFNAARRTAIQGAVEEAKLRRSISEVFINLARRNQALLHRQLSLLDSMERRIADPDELEDLFRLDHLATRMRRHAEGLIILSGQAPGRGWRNPVPAVDVVRAAAAEVEDYARVTVTPMPRVAVAGPAVADLIHLLAELIENATMFSPPHTTVQVSGQLVAHGFAVEIEDRGLSMDPAALAAANERLADPPEFDLSNSARIGLFVVGRLAKRHSVQVTLRTSPYGGTTAIVLVPGEIVVRDDGFEIEGRPPALTRRAEESLVPVGAIGGRDAGHAGQAGQVGQGGRGQAGPGGAVQGGSSWFDSAPGSPSIPSASPSALGGRDYHDYPQPDYPQPDYPPTGPGGPGGAAGPGGNGFPEQQNGRPPLPQRRSAPEPGPVPQPPVWHTQPPLAGPHGNPAGPAGPAGPPGNGRPGNGVRAPAPRAPYAPQSPWPPRQPPGPAPQPPGSPVADHSFGGPPSSGEASFGGAPFGDHGGGQRPYLPGASRPGRDPSRRSPGSRGAASGGPGSLGSPGAGARDGGGAAPSGGPRPELPRRVRQASLAPQLREDPIPDTLDPAVGDDERSPEELRTMLSSIQKGWMRGRTAPDDESGGAEPGLPAGAASAGAADDGAEPAPGPENIDAEEQVDKDQREDQ
jgi:signal transduction histidine kinase